MNILRKNSAHHFRMQSELEQILVGDVYLAVTQKRLTDFLEINW